MITLRNKIGQMLIMGFNGAVINETSPVAQWLINDGLGGVLLFNKDVSSGMYGKNLKNQAQIKQLTHQLNFYANASAVHKRPPLLISLDYEGGVVDRLSTIDDCMTTMKPSELAHLSDKALEDEVQQMAITMQTLGFNLNFAPVVDLNLNEQQGIIGKLGRSFSDDPKTVASVASKFVQIFNRYNIACAYKHFPGHGSAVGDTHEGLVDVSDTFNEKELIPYRQLLKENAAFMVMTAHVRNTKLDREGLPATLSHTILSCLLREEIGYDGVIVSDDMQMQAIASQYSLEEALCLTINAGVDMIIFANQLGSITAPEVINCIEFLVTHKKIDQHRIDEAFKRIMRLKQQLQYNNTTLMEQ